MSTTKQSWWSRATTEQKLAQIDGAIECGLGAKFVAANCGAGYGSPEGGDFGAAVRVLASRYGRRFGYQLGVGGKAVKVGVAKLCVARHYGSNITNDAFDIFGTHGPDQEPFIDEVAT